MSLLSSVGLAPRPSPTPAPAPAPSSEPTATSDPSGTDETQSTSSTSQTSSNTQNGTTVSGDGSSQTSEPGVTYQSAQPDSARSNGPQPATAPIVSTPEAAPARFSISNGPTGTITEQTASILAAARLEEGPSLAQDIARPDIAELVAAFTAQFAGSERRNLEMLL